MRPYYFVKIWITKNSDVPVRTQIVSQIRVAIASGDLRPGDRLPSTRELARRFGVHSNTVSAAYRELASTGAVDLRKGSGIYVSENGRDVLDALIDNLHREANRAGFTRRDVIDRILGKRGGKKIDRFCLYEPDQHLAEIIRFELFRATGLDTLVVTSHEQLFGGALLTALFDERERVRQIFGETECFFLNTTSVADAMSGRARPGHEDLIAVVSTWRDFLAFARLYLLAAGLDSASVITVSTLDEGWRRRLGSATLIICDTLSARGLAGDARVVAFPLISDDTLNELKILIAHPIVSIA